MNFRGAGKNRILGLEVRPRFIGFALIEDGLRLLDWGTRRHRNRALSSKAFAVSRAAALVDTTSPTLVVVRSRQVRGRMARRRLREIFAGIRSEAGKRSIKFRFVSSATVRRFLARHGCYNKAQGASLIAKWFPELSFKLPPPRKRWKSEDQRMLVFDAAATALACLNRSPPAAS